MLAWGPLGVPGGIQVWLIYGDGQALSELARKAGDRLEKRGQAHTFASK